MNFAAFRNTKLYDFIAALPVALWFGFSAAQLRPALARDGAAIAAGSADLVTMLEFFALMASVCFYLLLVYLLLVREKPLRRSPGLLPYLCGFLGTFVVVGILRLPVARLSLPWAAAADLLIFIGSALSAVILWRLGKSFSIMPEARGLVTNGPYAYARHPLYAAEMLTVTGIALQFEQPWALLLAMATAALQVTRSVFEERVLSETFADYAAYRARTRRFIPGVI